MDYSNLTTVELTAVSNAFWQFNEILDDFLPENFPELLMEYVQMDEAERMQLQQEMSAKANFMAYAETLGAPEMADALQKVASDMSKMDSKSLNEIAKSGVSKLATK